MVKSSCSSSSTRFLDALPDPSERCSRLPTASFSIRLQTRATSAQQCSEAAAPPPPTLVRASPRNSRQRKSPRASKIPMAHEAPIRDVADGGQTSSKHSSSHRRAPRPPRPCAPRGSAQRPLRAGPAPPSLSRSRRRRPIQRLPRIDRHHLPLLQREPARRRIRGHAQSNLPPGTPDVTGGSATSAPAHSATSRRASVAASGGERNTARSASIPSVPDTISDLRWRYTPLASRR